ncbi:aspartate--ammonia ligase [Hathewaya histolytica]|uniref:Aspartate--ammonia ligase n=1 Tax=Hathewaya histolytica TaxID=1498 RepID=A0A4U9RCI5_HATHI|nr:aspartate--ammonia ligase [Hathewaya histolytica]VTQ89424.1 aspartate--ammonia ligase AsnA [Hathewaya histolytica]
MVDLEKLELTFKKTTRDIKTTEINIKRIKDFFENKLAKELNLIRVSAPLFVKKNSGMNDNLNGYERPVSFDAKNINDNLEIVQSLAKWKRMALAAYNFNINEGLYTDMNAIRRDEDLDKIHSFYVDQWDWEKIISKENRTLDTLKVTVNSIYKVFKETEEYIQTFVDGYKKVLPDSIFFITSQELEDMYPELTPKERENKIAYEKKAVFLMKIGDILNSGKKHDGRSPDYDDWNLNGDILFWYPELESVLEVSSMGIRVDEKSLMEQLQKSNLTDRKELPYHKALLQGKLPYTIGGGIGQSRICMFFLKKKHIGEVQCSIWDEETLCLCQKDGIDLL